MVKWMELSKRDKVERMNKARRGNNNWRVEDVVGREGKKNIWRR
jgi:hypothetical protein